MGYCTVKIGNRKVTGKTHVIVLPQNPSPSEKRASEEMRNHLKMLTGETIAITRKQEPGKKIPLAVGKSLLAESLFGKLDTERLGNEGVLIKTAGPALLVSGGKRGVLYSCYTFLEDYLGFRWFTPDCTAFPEKGTINISNIDFSYIPPLEYRWPWSITGFDPDWSVRNKANAAFERLDDTYGGKIFYKGFVHTFRNLVPPEKYFKSHPEYFSEINGRRVVKGTTQLCLTNPAVEDIVVRQVKKWLKEIPDAGIVSVSQNDSGSDGRNCECRKCREIDMAEGSPSGSLLRFVNRVAERVEKDYPGVAIDTLAYRYTRKPPKITRPRDNVIVRLCSIESSFARPLTDRINSAFRKDIEGWAKISKRLYIWDYVTNFAHYIQPHPNLAVLAPNIRFFIKNNVKGIFEQGNGQSYGGEMQELRTWLLAKLLWNPGLDDKKLIYEFLKGYYGKAAPFLKKYIDLMHNAVIEKDTYLDCYSPPDSGFLTPDVLSKAEKFFDAAERSVHPDKKLLGRVQKARLPVLYVKISRARNPHRKRGDRLVASGKKRFLEMVESFEKIAKNSGATRVKEGGGSNNLEEWVALMKRKTEDLKILKLKNFFFELSILPELGGRIWRMRYLPEKKDILRVYNAKNGFLPFSGGYKDCIAWEGTSAGCFDKYRVVEHSPQKTVIETKLNNGISLRNTYELGKSDIIKITATLFNRSDKTVLKCISIQPDFEAPDISKIKILIKQNNGGWTNQPFPPDKKTFGGGKELWLSTEKLKFSEWAMADRNRRIVLINKFRADEVEFCRVFFSGKDKAISLILYSPAVNLKPGDRLEIRHTYKIVPYEHFFDLTSQF
jgi:hypothetical protein